MAFHSGWNWWDDRELSLLLKKLNENAVTINVLANPESTINKIAKEFKDPDLEDFYMGFDETMKKWHEWESKLSNLHFRVSELPILRKVYIVTFKDGTSKGLLRDYIYGFTSRSLSPHIQLDQKDILLDHYTKEFYYLWNKSYNYTDWASQFSNQIEYLPSGDYILVCHHNNSIHDKSDPHDTDCKRWYLNSWNNQISILPDGAKTNTSKLTGNDICYGISKLGNNSILIEINQINVQGVSSILLNRPIDNSNRYFGVMSGLDSNGYPFSCKCICVRITYMNKIDGSVINKLLENNACSDICLSFSEQDINLFYQNNQEC